MAAAAVELNSEPLFPAFAKLQGKDFEYYMRKYSIIVGRNSKKGIVDLDLMKCDGGDLAVSRRHARIYYDFASKYFALEVIGRNGCYIRNVPFEPGSEHIKLNSQDLIQIGEVRFYFLLPTRSFLETLQAAWKIVPPPLMSQSAASPTSNDKKGEETQHDNKEAMAEAHISNSIVHQFSAREAGVSSSGTCRTAKHAVSSLPPELIALPLSASNGERKGEKVKGDGEESEGTGQTAVAVTVTGFIVQDFNENNNVENFNVGEVEDPSGGLSGTFEAARKVESPLHCSLVVFPNTYSNGEGKCEEIDGGRKRSVGGLDVALNVSGTEGLSDMLSGGMKQFCLSGSKEETPDLHVFRVNLPGINKEQIKLELEEGKIWIQISAENAIENMDNTCMLKHCVKDSSCKFLKRHLVLPKDVKIDQIKAVMEDGVLTVTVPKGDVEISDKSAE